MSWTIKAAREEFDDFVYRIQNIISVGQIWSVIEGMRLAEDPKKVLEDANREAEEQELTTPDDMTASDLDDYINSVLGEGWSPQDIMEEIELRFPQTVKVE